MDKNILICTYNLLHHCSTTFRVSHFTSKFHFNRYFINLYQWNTNEMYDLGMQLQLSRLKGIKDLP